MSERAQALEHLQRLARDIGDVRDVAGRRSDPPREHQQMLARLGQWRGGILTVIDILQAPAEGVSPQPDTRRDCTCLGTCKGADGLSPRYRCALQHPAHVGPYCSYSAPVSPVEPTPPHTGWGPDKLRDCPCVNCQVEPTPRCPICKSVDQKRNIDGLWQCPSCWFIPSAPTAVEPAPEPPTNPPCRVCGHPLLVHRPEFGLCDGSERPCACPEFVSTMSVEPAPPAPCVWREEWVEYGNNHGRDEVKTGCGLSEDADEMRPLMKWPFCPQCGSPLKVDR